MINRGFSRYGKEILRCETCNRCKYSVVLFPDKYKTKCTITKRDGNIIRAEVCEHFEYRCPEVNNTLADDGLRYRSKQGRELLTESQWNSYGFVLKDNAVGEPMHPVRATNKVCIYYSIDQVEKCY